MLCVKQETAYDVRISDWSSDVCSSDLLVLLADQVRGGNLQIIEEQFGRRMVEHRADGADRQAVALRLAHVDEQHAHPVGGLGTILARGGAAEEEIGRASWRGRVCQYVWISVVGVTLKQKE